MVIVRIKGGLGNQLFQYATGYSLAKRLKTDLKIDSSFFPSQMLRGYRLSLLSIWRPDQVSKLPLGIRIEKSKYLNYALRRMNIRQLGGKTKYLLETRSQIVPEFFSVEADTVYVDGYYQSEKYFVEYRKDLLQQFVPRYEPENEYTEMKEIVTSCNSVAVHVRRGDFITARAHKNPNRYVLQEDYYVNAIKEIKKHVDHPRFFWFSDDIEWVKQHIGMSDDYHFVTMHTAHPDVDEMMLMTECRNIITANSTFSWWAAWMSKHNGIVVCPQRRYGNIEMIPDSWIKV